MEYIDLGLPSGTKWANMNIGAATETDCGLYFQWGDVIGYNGEDAKEHSFWHTCPANDGKSKSNVGAINKWYNANVTNRTLNTNVDAAYVHTKGEGRMPTLAQLTELFRETEHSYETINGVNCGKFINKNDSNKYILVPAGGFYGKGSKYKTNYEGCLWSRSPNHIGYACSLEFSFDNNICPMMDDSYFYAQNVRAVLNDGDK